MSCPKSTGTSTHRSVFMICGVRMKTGSCLSILNRRCEEALIALEALASQASIPLGTEHDTSWKYVLFTQFHDTIGGSCSDDV